MPNKILFITEGPVDEQNFIERLFKVINKKQEYEIIPYKTNLHVLADEICDQEGNIDDTLEIKRVLKSKETDKNNRKKLEFEFSDIILVFDLDPQDDRLLRNVNKIKNMLTFFNDSTINGKLYINYPMMQSYRDFTNLPDPLFYNKEVDEDEFCDYKEIVNSRSKYKNINSHSYSLFISLAYHHLLKYNYIVNGIQDIVGKSDFLRWDGSKLFEIQISRMKGKSKIYIINTFIFFLVEFQTDTFFEQIKIHKNKYSI